MTQRVVPQSSYMRDFPTDVPKKAAQGALLTGGISFLVGSSPQVALLGAALAVTATVVEAVARPVIRYIFSDTPCISAWVQVIFPVVVAFGAGAALAPWIGISYVMTSLVLSVITWVALNCGNDGLPERNVAMAFVF